MNFGFAPPSGVLVRFATVLVIVAVDTAVAPVLLTVPPVGLLRSNRASYSAWVNTLNLFPASRAGYYDVYAKIVLKCAKFHKNPNTSRLAI